MSTWIAFCDQGHELIRVTDSPPDNCPKICKHCGSQRIEFFSDIEVEFNLGKIITNQTIICQNLSTKHQFHDSIPVYDVKGLFASREMDRSAAKIKVKSGRRNK